jgi:hypothetical protein
MVYVNGFRTARGQEHKPLVNIEKREMCTGVVWRKKCGSQYGSIVGCPVPAIRVIVGIVSQMVKGC